MMVVLFQEEQLDEIFNQIASKIDRSLEGFLIGGLAMIKNKMKTATKDIDIVFSDEEEAREFIRAAQEVGFNPDIELPSEYEEMDAMIVLKEKEERRIDVFVTVVMRGVTYTESMKNRAESVRYGDKLTIQISSNEDVFLYKSISPRDRDLNDMETLARTGDIDWETIEGEARNQPTPWKWIGHLFGRLLELEAKTGIVTPLTSRLEKEAEIGQAIEILLGRFGEEPVDKKNAMRILREEDTGFVDEVFSTMVRYGLVAEKDGKYWLQ